MTWGQQGGHGEDREDTTIMINMLAAICNCLLMCVHVCMHVHVCAHVWGHPQTPRPPTTHLPPPRATGSPKHQNSISPELIKII